MTKTNNKTIPKLLLIILIFFLQKDLSAQVYRNEWIDYSQSYYKFKIANDSLFRISKEKLDELGWGNVPVEHFQLWRNGQLVPFYPSVNSGPLPAGGYLEFWGKRNDGVTDEALYLDPQFQHTNRVSIITDSATYFLSYNSTASGKIYTTEVNDIASNTLPAEPYFKYTAGNYYKNQMHQGNAENLGEYVYASSYDRGEFWSSANITPGTSVANRTYNFTNLRVVNSSNKPMLTFGLAGSAPNTRPVEVTVGGSILLNTTIANFGDYKTTIEVDPALIVTNNSLAVVFRNGGSISSDRIVISHVELTYDRAFNFNGLRSFEFTLAPKTEGYYLEITNFTHGNTAPVLYDITNGKRYVGNISNTAIVKFVLPGDSRSRDFVLVNQQATNFREITQFTPVSFINYADVSNQGNYIIISNKILYSGSNGNNPIVDYANYRSSGAGGGFQAIYVEQEQLIDQFGYGIKKHPAAIRNFIQFAQNTFVSKPKNFFIIGRGIEYRSYRLNQNRADVELLNLVPTFGNPGSDNLFSSTNLKDATPVVPIGRLSVVHPYEVEQYLDKVKQHENLKLTAQNTIADKAWMKNIVNVTGSSSEFLGNQLCNYMTHYGLSLRGPTFGGNVHLFCKTSASGGDLLNSERITQLFAEGINVLSYFGHSSATTLEFNIESPENYSNTNGKYPLFLVNGCNAGNFFTYYPARMMINETLTESFVLAKDRGAIGFIASTHYGVVSYLNVYMESMTQNITKYSDALTVGELLQKSLKELLVQTGPNSYLGRLHVEQITLHGDPAVRLFADKKPDYAIEASSIRVNPNHISVSEINFEIDVKVHNLGKAITDSLMVKVEQIYPDGTSGILFLEKIKAVNYADSVKIIAPIVATRDKGLNKIRVYVNPDRDIDEIDYNNNYIEKEIYIFEEGISPAYPYEYAIVNVPDQKLYASTSNPFSTMRSYIVQMDTTETFNSGLKAQRVVSSVGGLVEIDALMSYQDGKVYYWRVAEIPPDNDTLWSKSSFIYKSGSSTGFNQSHYYQHLNSQTDKIGLSSNNVWNFDIRTNNIAIRNGVFPSAASQAQDFLVNVNDDIIARSVCGTAGIYFVVLDPLTLKPWVNGSSGSTGKYNSDNVCGAGRENQFQFNYAATAQDSVKRRYAMEFLDMIPDGHYVIVRNIFDSTAAKNMYYEDLKMDTLVYGSNNSLYHKLLSYGFNELDQINSRKAYIFVFKKNKNLEFAPRWVISNSYFDRISLNVPIEAPYSSGTIESPVMGPATAWTNIEWRGHQLNNETADSVKLEVYLIDKNNVKTKYQTLGLAHQDLDISMIDAAQYPYMQFRMLNSDTAKVTPYQLDYWRVIYKPSPEGAVVPNIRFYAKDTLETGENMQVQLAFKNISKESFDSLTARITVIDNNNVSHVMNLPKFKPLVSGDTILLDYSFTTEQLTGNNTMLVEINPSPSQSEQYLFNNFIYHDFYVKGDQVSPVLDVTFDGVRILSGDIVSAKPMIQIKLTDDSKFLLLNDTSLVSVQLKHPNGTIKHYYFNNGDTLRLVPATNIENNEATIEFTPFFTEQLNAEGDQYELIVRGRDRSGNRAGMIDYRTSFKVITKSMISNMLNYPNPFSTSTAFVFTLTGSEVPKNFKIQILTITGKIVREITREELGPLHIGRNITEFKWDGTDQFGQKLANGVYLYRVVTSLNGNRLEKYKASGEQTDQFFVNGYGKMYIMR